jgi:ABC-type Co2+ transport system permease subunit
MLNIRVFKSFGRGASFTLGYILTLYATLPLAPEFIRWVKEAGAIQAFVLGPFVLSVPMLGYAGLKAKTYRNRSFWVAILLLGALFYLISEKVMAPVELLHLILYGIMCILFFSLFSLRLSGAPLFGASALATSIFGAIDEIIQYYLPNRFFDWNDIVFNIIGGMMALIVIRFIFGDKGK